MEWLRRVDKGMGNKIDTDIDERCSLSILECE